jgi:hypothetical protein
VIVQIPSGVWKRELVDPGKGEHLWMLMVGFKMPDDAARKIAEGKDPGPVLMDTENMIIAPEAGCYKCEEGFSPRLYHRKCTGRMEQL